MTKQSESIAALAAALIKAKSEIPGVVKNAENPHLKNTYADINAIMDTVDPVLLGHGLMVLQFPSSVDGAPALTTRLMHESGEWVEDTGLMAATGRNGSATSQDMGSAITYARRYGYTAMLGLKAVDDDGNAASVSQREAQAAAKLISADQRREIAKAAEAAGLTLEQAQAVLKMTAGVNQTANVTVGKFAAVMDALTVAADTVPASDGDAEDLRREVQATFDATEEVAA